MELEITSPALGALDRKDAAEPQGRAFLVRPHRISRLPDHPAGRRRLLRAAQRLYRRRIEDASGLGFRGPDPAGGEECRHLRHGDRHARRRQRHLRHSRPAFRLGHLLLPQGPVRRRRPAARQDLGRVQGGSAEAAHRRRRRLLLHRRQRLLACGGRLVHALHHHRRRADDGQPEGEELQAAGQFAGRHRRSADADRPVALRAEERHQIRLRRERRRLLDRQDRADDLLVDDRRPGPQFGELDGRRNDRDDPGPVRRRQVAERHPGRLGRRHPEEPRPGAQGRRVAGADLDHQQGGQPLLDREVQHRRQPQLGLQRPGARREVPLSQGRAEGDRDRRTPSRPAAFRSSSS